MPIDLASLLAPTHTAVLTMECQEGVIGPNGVFRELVEAVEAARMVENLADLLTAARGTGVRVIHCTFAMRPDGAGGKINTPMQAASARSGNRMLHGSPAVRILSALGPQPEDIVVSRLHGIIPFAGTELDAILRNLGITTVIATGVSLNVGVTGLVLEAATRGYSVVLPRDCVAGFPPTFVEATLAHSLRVVATVTTKDAIKEAWCQH